jgi:UDP-glucose 4-epimerase
MKVLFIGGTGNISSASSRLAINKGIELYHLNRGNTKANVPTQVKTLTADIKNRAEVLKVLKDHFFDVVVNWIAFKPEDVNRDIEYFTNKTK